MKRKLVFEKVMSRDSSVIMTQMWQDYFLNTGKLTVNKWPKVFFIYRNGITESWRPTKIFFGGLPRSLARWVEKSKSNEQKVYKLISDYKKYSPQIKKVESKIKTSSQVFKQIEGLISISNKAAPGLALGYWMKHWDQELKIAKYPERISKLGEEIRKTDSLFDDTSEAVYKLLIKLSQLSHLSYSHLKVLNLKEIKEFVKNTNSKRILKLVKLRKGSYFFYDSKTYGLSGIEKFLKKNRLELKDDIVLKKRGIITGQSANPGKVKGTVRLILNREQSGSFKKNEILVTPMTTPWYVPLMKKARAIVTDEGGVMCHAAIISRELNKPCVIGTKIATKVLKDGDLVEVDANRGIVRLIKDKPRQVRKI